MLPMFWIVIVACLVAITLLLKMFAAEEPPMEAACPENYDADDEVDAAAEDEHALNAIAQRQLRYRKRRRSEYLKRQAQRHIQFFPERRCTIPFNFGLIIVMAFAAALISLPLISCSGVRFDTDCEAFCDTPLFVEICFSESRLLHDCCLYCASSRVAYLTQYAQLTNFNQSLGLIVPEFLLYENNWEFLYCYLLIMSGSNYSDPTCRPYEILHNGIMNNAGGSSVLPYGSPFYNMGNATGKADVVGAVDDFAAEYDSDSEDDDSFFDEFFSALNIGSGDSVSSTGAMLRETIKFDCWDAHIDERDDSNAIALIDPNNDLRTEIVDRYVQGAVILILVATAAIFGLLCFLILRALMFP